MGSLLTVLVFTAAACVPSATDAPAPRGGNGMTLQPAPAGLNVIGSGGREIGFGRDRPGVLASVTSITGTRPTAIACLAAGRDAYQVSGDLVIVFRGKAFAGWQTGTARAGEGC